MASIDVIWFQSSFTQPDSMKIKLLMPMGTSATIDVQLPPEFKDVVLKIAQTAADQHEQQVRAHLLAESQKEKT